MRSARAHRSIGTLLMVSSLLVGVLTPLSASAAEGDGLPENLQTVEEPTRAYWNADKSNYSSNVATTQFPPAAVCLVQPQACFFPESDDPQGQLGGALNEGISEIDAAERELLATMADNDEGATPADPVPPDSSPVSIAFGQPNYRSALAFPLPDVAEGQQVDSFTLVLKQGQPTYSNESPAFRQAVLAALTCASENDEPQGRCTQEEFEKVPTRDMTNDSPLLVEACPITGDWEAGTSQDEDTLPEVDCLYTAAGSPIEVDGDTYWVFDLGFMAKAWYDGLIEPNGILFRPGAAENFAYGDPEATYSKQVTFDPEVQIAVATSEAPAPFAPPPPFTPAAPSSAQSDVFATPPSTTSGADLSVPSGGSAVPPATTSEPVAAPSTAAPVAAEPTVETLAAGAPLGLPETPWWIWLLVPVFLGGAWLLSRSLEEQAVVATAGGRSAGAMTRLLERNAAARRPDLVSG